MARTAVGILRGGTSSEYPLSLKTGAAMLAALPEDRYDARDIFIDKQGYWHLRGVPVEPARAFSQIDVVLNALHGGAGEDGTVQRMMERAGVPYAGSRPFASALSLNKVGAREVFRKNGIPMPRGVSFTVSTGLTTGEMAQLVFEHFGPPYVVKPTSEGAGSGIRIARALPDLPDTLGDVLDAYGAAIVEEYIRGEEASVAVLENFRGESLYAFPPAHVQLPTGMNMLTPELHEAALLRYVVPSRFSFEQKAALAEIARAAHRALGLSHFSRADIILTPRGPVLLEVNATPGLYPGASLLPMLESVGSSVREFLEHAIHLAKG